MPAHFLLKSEPSVYSWDDLLRDKKTRWDGVRNFQARAVLQSMKVGDLAFIYHSNEGKEIVGIARVVKTAYPDPKDETGKFVCVDIEAVKPLKKPVTLETIKGSKVLKNMKLVKQSRLSCMPVAPEEWEAVLQLSA